ncbi:MAG: hypothetical protein ABI579_00605 [Candidatus Sumerlaeota bacterium]
MIRFLARSIAFAALSLSAGVAFAASSFGDSPSTLLDTVAPDPGTAFPPPTGTLWGFDVPFSGASDTSGIARISLQVRSTGSWGDSGDFATTTSGTISFVPTAEGTYVFDLVAEDNVGNRSVAPSGDTGDGDGFTLVRPGDDHDSDNDGIPDIIEMAAPNGGDGNDDGTQDSLQANVVSLPNAISSGENAGDYLTLVSPPNTVLSAVEALPPGGPMPGGVISFPVGLIGFTVSGPGVAPFPNGNLVTLIIENELAIPANSYFKQRDGLYTPFDAPVLPLSSGATGASFDGRKTYGIMLADGGNIPLPAALSGDSNPVEGVITDPGGPAIVTPLLVTLESFTATSTPSGVRLDWVTIAETNNAGFNIFRADLSGLTKLNGSFIPAEGIEGGGAVYTQTDSSAMTGSYFLEDVDLNGTKTLHGPVTASLATAGLKDWTVY